MTYYYMVHERRRRKKNKGENKYIIFADYFIDNIISTVSLAPTDNHTFKYITYMDMNLKII